MKEVDEKAMAYSLRLPANLKLALQEQAKQSGRSLNSEIIYRLKEYDQVSKKSQENGSLLISIISYLRILKTPVKEEAIKEIIDKYEPYLSYK